MQRMPASLAHLLCCGFISVERCISAAGKWRTGQGLAAGGSVHSGEQNHSQLQRCPRFPSVSVPLFQELSCHCSDLQNSFSLCLSSKLEGLGWQGWSPAVFLLLAFLLSFVPAVLSPALMPPLWIGKADGRKMQCLETLSLSAPTSF